MPPFRVVHDTAFFGSCDVPDAVRPFSHTSHNWRLGQVRRGGQGGLGDTAARPPAYFSLLHYYRGADEGANLTSS